MTTAKQNDINSKKNEKYTISVAHYSTKSIKKSYIFPLFKLFKRMNILRWN